MRGRVTWLFVLALGAGPWAWGQELPKSQPQSGQKKPAAIDPADKDAPDKGKDKDKDKDKDESSPNGKAAESEAATVTPIYYPLDPFPPAAPPVLDPRTGGWEQVQGGHYVMTYQPNLPCGHPTGKPATDTPPTPTPQPKVPVRADAAGPLQQAGGKVPPGRTIRFVKDARTGAWVIGEIPSQR